VGQFEIQVDVGFLADQGRSIFVKTDDTDVADTFHDTAPSGRRPWITEGRIQGYADTVQRV
jgi:hypothetical protein